MNFCYLWKGFHFWAKEKCACKNLCQISLLQEDLVWRSWLAGELGENILLQVAKDHRITWMRKRAKAHLGGIELRISPRQRTLLESGFALQEWNFATLEKVFILRQRENCACKDVHPIDLLQVSFAWRSWLASRQTRWFEETRMILYCKSFEGFMIQEWNFVTCEKVFIIERKRNAPTKTYVRLICCKQILLDVTGWLTN